MISSNPTSKVGRCEHEFLMVMFDCISQLDRYGGPAWHMRENIRGKNNGLSRFMELAMMFQRFPQA